MKPILKNIIVPAVSAVVGGVAVVAALKMSPSIRTKIDNEASRAHGNEQIYDDIIKRQERIRNQLDDFFNEDIFGQNDPFEEMKKMRQQMEKSMEKFGEKGRSMSNPFDSWFSDKF